MRPTSEKAKSASKVSSRGSLEGCGKSVPKLRFPRFAGEWNKYSLNECLSVYCKRNKGRFTKEEVLSVSGEFGIVNQIEFQGRSFAGESITNYKVISPGLLVYTKSPLREAPYGIVKASRTTNGIVSPLYGVYTSSDKVIPCFVEAYFANALRRNRYFKPLVNLGPKHTMCISDEGALAGTITLPEIEEQSRICDFLLVLDSRITAQRRLVELLKKQKRGLLREVFEEKIEGDCYSFSEVACRRNEKIAPTKDSRLDCIELEHIEPETGMLLGSVPLSGQNSLKNLCKPSDIVFGKLRPYLRKFVFAENKCAVSSETWVLTAAYGIYPKFLFYLIQSEPFMRAASVSSGTKMPRSEWSNVANAKFYIPDAKQQVAIADCFSKVDCRIQQSQRTLVAMETYKRGLLQQLFV